MPEIGMSGSMSGDGKRSVGHRPQATAPILNSTCVPPLPFIGFPGGRAVDGRCSRWGGNEPVLGDRQASEVEDDEVDREAGAEGGEEMAAAGAAAERALQDE